jgi:ribosomal protein L11 methyltransferase
LAAARLGCNSALALDFNFLAAKTAKRNIELNGLEDKILAFQGRAEDFIAYPADLVIANIHYDVMKELVAAEGFLSKKWFILSGLLRTEARDIAYKLSRLPVNILKTRERDGVWHTFFGEISA